MISLRTVTERRELPAVAAERALERRQQVARHHPDLRLDEARCEPVRDRRGGGRELRIEALRQERSDHAESTSPVPAVASDGWP